LFVVGDGRFGSERAKLKRWLRRAQESNIAVVYLAIDAPVAAATTSGGRRESLLDIQSVTWVHGKMTMVSYMEDFPFAFYMIVRDSAALPRLLADSLRQWFEISSQQ